MVIPYNELPFEFYIRSATIDNKPVLYDRIDFCDTTFDLHDDNYPIEIHLFENRDVLLSIHSEYDVKLYMDGFDALSHEFVCHKDGKYISEKDTEYKVFSYENFPLPPGRFLMTIQCNGKSYYAIFVVDTLHLGEQVWSLMASEIYDDIRSFALQTIRRRAMTAKVGMFSSGDFLSFKMSLLLPRYQQIIAILERLAANPRSRISTKYEYSNIPNAYRKTFHSNKLNAKKTSSVKRYVPVKYINQDLAENRKIKHMVLGIEDLLLDVLDEIKRVRNNYQCINDKDYYGRSGRQANYAWRVITLDTLQQYEVIAKKVLGAISEIKNCDWFAELQEGVYEFVPVQTMLDPRYNVINSLYNDLSGTMLRFSEHCSLVDIWKNTSQLYEMWGFVSTIKVLIGMGYNLHSGVKVQKGRIGYHITGLESNDAFVLENSDGVIVKAYYDRKISRTLSATREATEPIYIDNSRNTPDCRLDFYRRDDIKETYIASVIVDYKYRKRSTIELDEDVKNQAKAYRRDTYTRYAKGMTELQAIGSIRPVKFVWLAYPDIDNPTYYKSLDENVENNICLVAFTPGQETYMTDQLNAFVNEFVMN